MAHAKWVPCCLNCRARLGNPPAREIGRLTDGRNLTRPCSCGTETAWEANLGRHEDAPVIFRDPLNARDYATALNLLHALWISCQSVNIGRGHPDPCECVLCKALKATDDFLNHRTGG